MSDRTLSPALVREMLGPGALVGAGKVVFTNATRGQRGQGSFGGFHVLDILSPERKWRLVVGTLIVVPIQQWTATREREGWDLCDLIKEGLDHTRGWKAKP